MLTQLLQIQTIQTLTPDGRLLFNTRIVRLFAYGFLSVVLVLYLAQAGLSEMQIGLLLSLTLIGDTIISLWITTHADRLGRRRMLMLIPLMPNLPLAIAVLLLRFSISQMDVPTRQSYTMAVVAPDERSAAAGITGIARTTGAALAPVLTGLMLGNPFFLSGPFFIAGGLKLVYDLTLYYLFQTLKPPEEAQ